MQKTLLRQLKRCLGVAGQAEMEELLARLPALAAAADPSLRGLLGGFGELLESVGGAYGQYERDLDLRTRSLALSSGELSAVNEKLRQELIGRERALAALHALLRDLVPEASATTPAEAPAEEDIEALSRRIGDLVAESERGRRELANQKFALDQHAIVSITDPAGVIVYANDRFCEISGYRREELIGANHRLVNSGTHDRDFFRDMWGTITLGKVWHGEICNRARDGGLYWVNATIVPLLGKDGEPEQHIAIRTDITDRKRVEAQLSEQLHLIEALFEAIPVPVYLKDTAGRYLRLNRAFEQLFQVDRKALIGGTLHDLLRPGDAPLHARMDAELFAGAGQQTYEAVIHGRDGVRHDTIYRKAALTRCDGSVSGLLGTIIDITERKQAEAEAVQAKEAAEAASRAKSEFLANMSHEIRTPMNGVIGMTDLALDTALTGEQREYLDIVKSSAESLLGIINDILDFSKIEAGKLLVEQIPFDLHRAIADTLKPLALRAHEKNIELVSEILAEVPRHVVGDPGRLRQVLVNLVGNAIKFTAQGEIVVHAALREGGDDRMTIGFFVRDTGIGIPFDKQAMIFQAFAQEDTSTTRRYGGTGLGLSISRRLVELMGGDMWLQSRPGEGSAFHFTVRLQIDANPPPMLAGPPALRGRRVLVIDDNATNRRILAAILASREIACREADSGAAALDLMRRHEERFDCIILDAQMPGMDGYALARRMRTEFPALPPMLMLSSGAMRGDAVHCHEVGISGFFPKPVAAEDLLAALGEACGKKAPRAAESAPSSPLLTRHSLSERHRVLDILVVEDHPINQKLAVGLLEKRGHRPLVANDGREAVEMFASRHFDLILMDMQMPVMGGLEATLRIRDVERGERRPRTPIIAMTAAARDSDREACLAAGMDDYLAKPIQARQLLDKLLDFESTPE